MHMFRATRAGLHTTYSYGDDPMTAATNDTFELGGDITVNRMGFGAMRITGEGIWGWPDDRDYAVRLLERAAELGVDFIDTADSYGPETSEYLIAEAFAPYSDGPVVATKGGLTRTGPGSWPTDCRPERLTRCINNSLRRLETDTIDLYQLHAVDDDVPLEESLGALAQAKEAGKIRHVGVSNFTVEQLERARDVVEVASVQNMYNLFNRKYDDVLDYCTEHDIGFIPYFPIGAGDLPEDNAEFDAICEANYATPYQIALAWLLHRSPVTIPIPGTSSIEHLEQNVEAREVQLNADEMETLDGLA